MKVSQVLVSQVKDQLEPLAKKHLKETDNRLKNFSQVQINFDSYEVAEAQGMYALFIAEDEEVVRGYLSLYIIETPHIVGYRQAVADALFVDEEARKGSIAQRLIKCAENYAKDVACDYMTLCFKADNPHKRFCNSIGYQEDDIMYSKSLEV